MKKVLLINPARNYMPGKERKVCAQPLGLLYVASSVKQAGYDVRVIDAVAEGYATEMRARNGFVRYGLLPDQIKEKIKAYEPDIVGVGSVQSLQLYEAYEVFEITKAINPKIITIFGGAHASAMYEREVTKKEIDYIVVGEGEISFLELLRGLEYGRLHGETISGVAYQQNGDIIYKPGLRVQTLDDLPALVWDLLPMRKYHLLGASPSSFGQGRIAIIVTSRGCPHNCAHCPKNIVFGKGYRLRCLDDVISEIQTLIVHHGIEEIHIEDSNFTINRKRVLEFCQKILENDIKIRFSLPHGIEINTLDKNLLLKMWEAGFYALHLSIESDNDVVLGFQDKIIMSEKVTEIIDIAKEIGFLVTGYFMIGFPYETMDDINKTTDFAKKLSLDKVNFFIFTPLPGTVMYDQCMEQNLFIENFDITHLRYAKANLDTHYLSHKQIQKVRFEAWREIMCFKKSANGC